MSEKWTIETTNPNVVAAQYAVRGEIVIRANDIQTAIAEGSKKYNFDEVVFCNIGNPQRVGQKPLTFPRQVLSLLEYPQLIETAASAFPKDAIARAKYYLNGNFAGTGAYVHSQGVMEVRKEVCDYIQERDGTSERPLEKNIFLTNGASTGVSQILQCLIRNRSDGIMIPLPQYPLYSALICLNGGTKLSYNLKEDNNWGIDMEEIQAIYDTAAECGVKPRALCVINPGNPTGQALPRKDIESLIRFAHANELVLCADEVYQKNIYTDIPFCSFRKAVIELGDEVKGVQLISFHSTSKGIFGECGKRGGYFELFNIEDRLQQELYKLASISLCSNLTGQYMTGLMVNTPKEGDESYPLYKQEYEAIYDSLKRRSQKLVSSLNQLDGVSCTTVQGAMYAFPTITLPSSFIKEAKKANKSADMYYCLLLLEATGLCVVPGAGFGQKKNSFHFRTTFLPQEDKIDAVLEKLATFHSNLLQKYASSKL